MATYDELEKSLDEGNPVELYEFTQGFVKWYATSSDRDITLDGNIYVAQPIQRNRLESTQELAKTSIQLKLSLDAPVLSRFIAEPTLEIISLDIYRYHEGQTDSKKLFWTGRLSGYEYTDKDVQVSAAPISAIMQKRLANRVYSINCPYALYEAGCLVDKGSFSLSTTVSVVAGTQLTLASNGGNPDEYYNGGFIEFSPSSGLIQRRSITTHTGLIVTTVLPFYKLSVNSNVTVFPGCKHNLDDCENKFSNLDNYGGFPWTPDDGSNPFGINPVF